MSSEKQQQEQLKNSVEKVLPQQKQYIIPKSVENPPQQKNYYQSNKNQYTPQFQNSKFPAQNNSNLPQNPIQLLAPQLQSTVSPQKSYQKQNQFQKQYYVPQPNQQLSQQQISQNSISPYTKKNANYVPNKPVYPPKQQQQQFQQSSQFQQQQSQQFFQPQQIQHLEVPEIDLTVTPTEQMLEKSFDFLMGNQQPVYHQFQQKSKQNYPVSSQNQNQNNIQYQFNYQQRNYIQGGVDLLNNFQNQYNQYQVNQYGQSQYQNYQPWKQGKGDQYYQQQGQKQVNQKFVKQNGQKQNEIPNKKNKFGENKTRNEADNEKDFLDEDLEIENEEILEVKKYKRDPALDTPDEMRKWLERRKQNYPSQKRVEQNQKELQEKIDAGELMEPEVSILEKRLRKKISILTSGSQSIKNLEKKAKTYEILKRVYLQGLQAPMPVTKKINRQYNQNENKPICQGYKKRQPEEKIEIKEESKKVVVKRSKKEIIKTKKYLDQLAQKLKQASKISELNKENRNKKVKEILEKKALEKQNFVETQITEQQIENEKSENESEDQVQEQKIISKDKVMALLQKKEQKEIKTFFQHIKQKQNEYDNELKNAFEYKFNSNNYRYKANNLLTGIVIDEIYQERSIILQLIRYLVNNQFFDPKEEIKINENQENQENQMKEENQENEEKLDQK